MDDARDRSPVEALCDVFVYAPLGFALEAPKLLPELAAKGRNQVAAARTVGRFVLSRAAGGLGPLAGSVLGGVLRGLSGSRRAAEPAGAGQPAASGTAVAAPPEAPADLDDIAVVPDLDEASLEPDAVGEAAGPAPNGNGSRDGQVQVDPAPAARRRDGAGEAEPSGPGRTGLSGAEGASDPGDGLSGAPLSDEELVEPDLDAPSPARGGSALAEEAEPSGEARTTSSTAPGSSAAPEGSDAPDGSDARAQAPQSAAALAIPEYDSLAASQVVPRLSSLSRGELSAVRAYEAAHRGRRTILGRADQLLARSSGSGA